MNTTILTHRDGEWVDAEPEVGERYRLITDKGVKGQRVIESVKTEPEEDSRITPKSFLSRFTVDEFVAIELASIDDPQAEISQRQLSAQIRLYLMKINSARYIDLNSDETVDGINSLIQHGFITSTRAYEVLNNPVGQLEKP